MDRIHKNYDKVHWRAFVDTVMNYLVPYRRKIYCRVEFRDIQLVRKLNYC
jgi:hypothetical protein